MKKLFITIVIFFIGITSYCQSNVTLYYGTAKKAGCDFNIGFKEHFTLGMGLALTTSFPNQSASEYEDNALYGTLGINIRHNVVLSGKLGIISYNTNKTSTLTGVNLIINTGSISPYVGYDNFSHINLGLSIINWKHKKR